MCSENILSTSFSSDFLEFFFWDFYRYRSFRRRRCFIEHIVLLSILYNTNPFRRSTLTTVENKNFKATNKGRNEVKEEK